PRPPSSTLSPYTTLFRSPIGYNVEMILMALLGGTGTVFGPAAGAVVLQLLIQFLSGSLPITLQIPFVPDDAMPVLAQVVLGVLLDRKSTRLNSSHVSISY